MSLFTELMKSAPSNAQGHKNMESIQAAYEQLDLEGRHAFLEEARAYIKSHNLESQTAHPRFNAGVFVYQAAVMAEVKHIENDTNAAKETSPEAVAEREAIKSSPTYKSFMDFKSKLDNHAHPDGLYGPVTHGLRYDAKMETMLEKIIEVNDKARVTPEIVAAPAPEVKAAEPAPAAVAKPAPKPAPVVAEEKKTERSVVLSHGESFGTVQHNYTAAMAEGLDGSKFPTFTSPTKAKQHSTTTDIAMQWKKDGKTADTIYKLGAALNSFSVKDANETVDVAKLTGFDGAGQATHTALNGNYAGNEKLATANALLLKGGIEKHLHLGDKLPDLIGGVRAGAGIMNTKIFNNDIRKSGVDLNGAYNDAPLPDASKRMDFAYTVGATFGLNETKVTPGLKLDTDITQSANAKMTVVGLNAFKSFDVGHRGVQINAQVGVTGMTSKFTHNGTQTQQTTVDTPENPNMPGSGGSVTTTKEVSGYNGSSVNAGSILGNLSPTAMIGVTIPLGNGKGR